MSEDSVLRPVVERLGPRCVERPGDAGFTYVGLLDDRHPSEVDRAGLIHCAGAGWSVDWWIGAEDRWYFPARETSVRQRRIGAGPVVETAMRIPGGDALHRCHRALDRGSPVTVIEIENVSATPVAFALAIRPYDLGGVGDAAPASIQVHADRVVVDGAVAVWLPRAAADTAVSFDDPIGRIQSGERLDGPDTTEGPSAHAVLVFPLPHRTKMRFVIPSPASLGRIDPRGVADHETVGRGWTTVVDRGGRFLLPDNGLSARADAARARLLVNRWPFDSLVDAPPGAGLVLEALAATGARQIVGAALGEFASSYPTRLSSTVDGAELAHALGRAACAHTDADGSASLLEPLAQLTGLVERAGDAAATSLAVRGLAWACRAAGHDDDAQRLFARAGGPSVTSSATFTDIQHQAESAGGTGSFGDDDLLTAARFWVSVRNLVLRETTTGIDLLAEFPPAWRGGSIEVHRAPSPFGLLSFAIRWHGYRPALLWDFEPRLAGVELRCSGLDPGWSTSEPRGEVLLAGTVDPLPDAPSPGDSFL